MDYLHAWLEKIGALTAIFVGVIVVLTLLSCASLLGEFVLFLVERHRLASLRARLEALDPVAKPEDWMTAALAGLPKHGYVRDRVAAIQELTRQQAEVELTALSDLAVEKSETSLPHNFARFTLLALLIIGLAGTFLALSATLTTSQLDKVAENGSFDADRYQQAVRNIYTGFGGAFTNSIFAIGGTVLLLFIQNVLLRPVKDGFFNALDTFAQVRLLPFCLGGREEPESLVFAAVSKLEAVVVGFRTVSRQLGEAVAKSDGASQQLGEVSQSLADAVRSFTETVGSQSGFQIVMERLYDTINRSEQRTGQMLAEFSGVAATVQEENVTLARMQEAMVDFQQTTTAIHRDFLAGLDRRNQRAAEALDVRQTTQQQALTETAAQMKTLVAELKPTLDALQTSLAREGERQALDRLDATLTRLDTTVSAWNQRPARDDGSPEPTSAALESLVPGERFGRPGARRIPAASSARPPAEQTALLAEMSALTAEIRRFFTATTNAAAPPAPPQTGWARLRKFLPGA